MPKSKRSFTATRDGGVPHGVLLHPGGIYVLQEEQQTDGQFPDRARLAAWIQNCVLGDLKTLRLGIATYLNDEVEGAAAGLGGGNFLLAAGCSTALEYFARIYHGQLNSVENVRKYAEAFLGGKYVEVSSLLQRALRNGLVHGSWPKTLCLESDPSTRIRVGIGVRPESPHLAPIPNWTGISLGINAVRFLEDLDRSVETGFVPWIFTTADDSVLKRGAAGLLTIASTDETRRQVQRVIAWNRRPDETG